jgi:hypothetical protein
MNTAILLVTCILAIFISIISVQLPRYFEHHADTESLKYVGSESAVACDRRPMTDGSHTPTKADIEKPPRRPWDPPFPTAQKHAGTKSEWLVLPPSSPRRSVSPMVSEHEAVRDDTREATRDDSPSKIAPETTRQQDKHRAPPIMSVLWTTLAVISGIFLVFSFAALIAHCLAWFIVYKTEARLGDARRGLVQGGEMRLCLCARG